MSTYWPYESCSRCSGKAQPGTVDLMKYLILRFPGVHSMGVYNCRLPSIHSCGRALDPGMPNKATGDAVVKFLNANAHQFGIHGQIWWRVRYDAKTPGGRYYTGPDPHIDHVHSEQRLYHATNLRFADYERLAGPAKGGIVPTYRKVQNVPWDNTKNQPRPWAKELIDDGIDAGVIVFKDASGKDLVVDWERPLNYGILWSLLDRLKWPVGTRQ